MSPESKDEPSLQLPEANFNHEGICIQEGSVHLIDIDQSSSTDIRNIFSNSATGDDKRGQMISSETSNIAHESILKEVHEVALDETDSELPQIVTPIAETNPKSPGSTPTIDWQRKELEDFLRLPSTEGYLRCLGKVKWCSEKLSNKASEAVGPSTVHLKSACTDLISTCGKVVELIEDTKNFAEARLQALQNQSDDASVMLENNTLIEDHQL